MSNRAGTQIAVPLFALLLMATSAWAGPPEPRVLQAAQSETVEANAYPWSVIGKLNTGMGGSCTAVLISPRHALTAAHCLFFTITGRFLPPQSLHLLFGYENQKIQSHYEISAYYVPPAYKPLRPYETLANDWALLSISPREGAATTRPLDIIQGDDAKTSSTLMTAGYSNKTPYAMTADRHCSLVGRSLDGSLLYDSCKAPSGYSGAPVLVEKAVEGSFSLAGIHVARQMFKTNAVAIAIPIDVIWREIKPCVEDNECRFQYAATERDPTAAELFSGLANLWNRPHYELSSSTLCKNATDRDCKTPGPKH